MPDPLRSSQAPLAWLWACQCSSSLKVSCRRQLPCQTTWTLPFMPTALPSHRRRTSKPWTSLQNMERLWSPRLSCAPVKAGRQSKVDRSPSGHLISKRFLCKVSHLLCALLRSQAEITAQHFSCTSPMTLAMHEPSDASGSAIASYRSISMI